MDKKFIEDILSLCLKYDLQLLANNMGLYGISKLTVSELKEEIIKENGLQNFDKILEKMSKDHLISTCEYLNIPFEKKKKEELFFKVKEFIKNNIKFNPQKQENVLKQKENINIPEKEKQIIISKKENIIEKPINSIKKNDTTIRKKLKVTYDDLIKIIEDSDFDEDDYNNTESWFRKKLSSQLEKCYNIIDQEHHIGSIFSLRMDIDINEEEFGIEVKKWKSLKAYDEIERAIGQAYIYSQNRYKNNNLLFVIYGTDKEYSQDRNKIEKLSQWIKEFNGKLYFKKVKY